MIPAAPLMALMLRFADPSAEARLEILTYRPDAVYAVKGAARTATQIIFSPQETIQHAAVGDGAAWEVVADGSVLFLKPRDPARLTNLLVVTEGPFGLRHYAFELALEGQSQAAYQLRFLYPDDERRSEALNLEAARAQTEARLATLALRSAAFSGARNLDYTVRGDRALQPDEVSDNGRFMVLRFAEGRPLPALFAIGEDGAETLVSHDVRGEFIVVHGVHPGLRLRRGDAVLCIRNEAFDPLAAPPALAAAERIVIEPAP